MAHQARLVDATDNPNVPAVCSPQLSCVACLLGCLVQSFHAGGREGSAPKHNRNILAQLCLHTYNSHIMSLQWLLLRRQLMLISRPQPLKSLETI